MKIYRGERHYACDRFGRARNRVTVTDDCGTRELLRREDVYPFVPGERHGFDWGNADGGARQLGLAILVDHWGDEGRALKYCQAFTFALIAGIDVDVWAVNGTQIQRVLDDLDRAARERAELVELRE